MYILHSESVCGSKWWHPGDLSLTEAEVGPHLLYRKQCGRQNHIRGCGQTFNPCGAGVGRQEVWAFDMVSIERVKLAEI